MTDEQASKLKHLAQRAYELDAFRPSLDEAEGARRIAALEAKLRLLDGPPHTLCEDRAHRPKNGGDSPTAPIPLER